VVIHAATPLAVAGSSVDWSRIITICASQDGKCKGVDDKEVCDEYAVADHFEEPD
jgi:hypothetical protein